MLILTAGFDRSCDLVGYIVKNRVSEISGMSERVAGDKTLVEIYAESDIRELLSKLFAGYILGPFRRRQALLCIAGECPFANDEEKELILSALIYDEYEPEIQRAVFEYIKENDFIDIPGFVRFRMPEFSKNVKEDTARVCENFIKARELEDMISLLRYHIGTSEPKGITRITFREDGGFCIVYPDGGSSDSEDIAGNGLDMVLGMLMVTVPEKLVIYNRSFAKDGVILAIEAVFGESVEYYK